MARPIGLVLRRVRAAVDRPVVGVVERLGRNRTAANSHRGHPGHDPGLCRRLDTAGALRGLDLAVAVAFTLGRVAGFDRHPDRRRCPDPAVLRCRPGRRYSAPGPAVETGGRGPDGRGHGRPTAADGVAHQLPAVSRPQPRPVSPLVCLGRERSGPGLPGGMATRSRPRLVGLLGRRWPGVYHGATRAHGNRCGLPHRGRKKRLVPRNARPPRRSRRRGRTTVHANFPRQSPLHLGRHRQPQLLSSQYRRSALAVGSDQRVSNPRRSQPAGFRRTPRCGTEQSELGPSRLAVDRRRSRRGPRRWRQRTAPSLPSGVRSLDRRATLDRRPARHLVWLADPVNAVGTASDRPHDRS